MSSTQVVRPDGSSHWYVINDQNKVESFHTVPYAGKRGKDGETRPTTLRDARKVGAAPSVTNVLSILHKEFLVAYKVNQAILAALTLPKIENESVDDFANRVVIDSKEHAASAARLGSRLHEVGSALITGTTDGLPLEGEMIEGRDLAEVAKPVVDLINNITPENLHTDKDLSEFYVYHPEIGYAGTCDGLIWLDVTKPYVAQKLVDAGYGHLIVSGDPVIAMADFKSRGAASKTAPIYETDSLQLSAYLNAIPVTPNLGYNVTMENTPTANILINTNEKAGKDGVWDAELVIHSKDELVKAWDAFLSLHKVWCWMKGYDPKQKGSDEQE